MERKFVIVAALCVMAWLTLIMQCSHNNKENEPPQQDTLVVEDTITAHEECNSAY